MNHLIIDETNFADKGFRNYITVTFDPKGKGYLTENEITSIEKINISGRNIFNVKGIEFFLNLKELDCRYNYISSLNISENVKLIKLYCGYNPLKILDVSANINLQVLHCAVNYLNELNVTCNKSLENLDCRGNKLKHLDVSQNLSLKELDCSCNYLTNLDVSCNSELKNLFCDNNSLIVLNVKHNPKLEKLFCDKNNLSVLDISENSKLKALLCYENQLTELNISRNADLRVLNCNNNQITQIDTNNNPSLEHLFVNHAHTTIEKYIRRGHQVLDKNKWNKWDKHVPISVNGLYHGLELEHVLKLIKMLDTDGCTFEDTYQELASQNRTNISLSIMISLLMAFCGRGQEFRKYITKEIGW